MKRPDQLRRTGRGRKRPPSNIYLAWIAEIIKLMTDKNIMYYHRNKYKIKAKIMTCYVNIFREILKVCRIQ